MKRDYDTEAKKLAKAIDIAIDSFIKVPPKDFTKEVLDHIINVYYEWKNEILNPKPKFRTIASLEYSIQDVFTYFQEGSGETVEDFWRNLIREKLPYIREDKLREIIDRGKIKRRIEYEFVIDSIIVARQEERITEKELRQLNEMIGEFEAIGKKSTKNR